MTTRAYADKPRIGHIFAVFGLFLSMFTFLFQSTGPGRTFAFGTGEVASLSNNYRASAGLPAYTINSQLTQSAQAKANDMASKGYFAHNSPSGATPWTFISNAGYDYQSAGENLALTNEAAASVVDGWYNSSGHRANMLSSTFTEVGYGIAFVPSFTYNGTVYSDVYLVAAHYGLPAQPAPAPAPAAPAPTNTTTTNQSSSPPASTPSSTPATAEVQTPTEQPAPTETMDVAKAPENKNTDVENTTSDRTPGVAVIQDTHAGLYQNLTYAGIALGGLFVLLGTIMEILRLLNHQPLIPHFH